MTEVNIGMLEGGGIYNSCDMVLAFHLLIIWILYTNYVDTTWLYKVWFYYIKAQLIMICHYSSPPDPTQICYNQPDILHLILHSSVTINLPSLWKYHGPPTLQSNLVFPSQTKWGQSRSIEAVGMHENLSINLTTWQTIQKYISLNCCVCGSAEILLDN